MERIISELEMPNEVEIQKSLRPKSFDEYIGQENLKEKMNIFIKKEKQPSIKGHFSYKKTRFLLNFQSINWFPITRVAIC